MQNYPIRFHLIGCPGNPRSCPLTSLPGTLYPFTQTTFGLLMEDTMQTRVNKIMLARPNFFQGCRPWSTDLGSAIVCSIVPGTLHHLFAEPEYVFLHISSLSGIDISLRGIRAGLQLHCFGL